MADAALILMMAFFFAVGGFALDRFCRFMTKVHRDSIRW